MVPLLLAAILAVKFVRLKHREAVTGVDWESQVAVKEWVEEETEEDTGLRDREKEESRTLTEVGGVGAGHLQSSPSHHQRQDDGSPGLSGSEASLPQSPA